MYMSNTGFTPRWPGESQPVCKSGSIEVQITSGNILFLEKSDENGPFPTVAIGIEELYHVLTGDEKMFSQPFPPSPTARVVDGTWQDV